MYEYVSCVLLVAQIKVFSVQAYIGPGAGFAVGGSFLILFVAFFSAIITFFTWPMRFIIRTIKGARVMARSRVKRVVIMGLDGMDPNLAEKYMGEGKLPNLSKLRKDGTFRALCTTIPSMSPVAWSSFQTGVNPGKHNIFDFLTRDKKTYSPRLSSVEIRGPKHHISIGQYQLPIGNADIRLLRKSKPFWETLGRHGIFSSIIRVPITFPPEKFYGVLLSGMCVPDLRGTQGMFSLYTTQLTDGVDITGGQYHIVSRNGKTISADLTGPENPFRKDGKPLRCRFKVSIKDDASVRISVNEHSFSLSVGECSEWIKVHFRAFLGVKIYGICRFILISVKPEFRLYVTPINIDPEKAAMPIAHPAVFSTYLAKRQGPFATLGLAEDSWALNEHVISDEEFINQSIQMDTEREKMFFDALEKVRRGLCVCVFDGTDRIQHTFWRDIDQEHPARNELSGRRNAVEDIYRRMDVLAGRVMDKCKDKDTLLMIISDHGFSTFRYGVDLNRWLEENGYLAVNQKAADNRYLSAVDWSRTRAFAIGLSGIFINVKDRESKGIVNHGPETERLKDEIAQKLCRLTDTERNNRPVIKNVYDPLKIYQGPYKEEAPDLLIGYNPGYRASWETAVGKVTDKTFHKNTKAWSGDHCIDASFVPGVLFCNRRIQSDTAGIMDIGPTVLDMFGVDVPKYMDGKPLIIAENGKAEKRACR